MTRPSFRLRRGLATLGLFAVAACGSQNSLEGSISESLPLGFDRVRVRLQDQAVLVEYLKDITGGTNKVCKLVIDGRKAAITTDADITDQLFQEAVGLERVANVGGPFPPVERGEVGFSSADLREGGSLSGDFDVVFINGRTLLGSFSGNLELVPLD